MTTTQESASIGWQHIYQARFEEHFRAGSLIRKMKSFWPITKGLIWLMNQNSYFAEQVCHTVLGLTEYNELLSSLLFKFRIEKNFPTVNVCAKRCNWYQISSRQNSPLF